MDRISIAPRLLDPRAAAGNAILFRAAPLPSLLLPSAMSVESASALRARVLGAGLRRYQVADRGQYALNDEHLEVPLFESLRMLAERVTGSRLVPAFARFTRLTQGDYALVADDARVRLPTPHLEALLDFSSVACGEAEITWGDDRRAFTAPQWPGSLSLVERRDPVARYERYLTHRVGDAEVFRLRLALAIA